MTSVLLSLAFVYAHTALGLAACICTWRLIRGNRAQDRVLAIDALYATTLLMFIVTGMRMGTSFFFEAAMVMSVMGFVTSVAAAKFLFRGEVIE